MIESLHIHSMFNRARFRSPPCSQKAACWAYVPSLGEILSWVHSYVQCTQRIERFQREHG